MKLIRSEVDGRRRWVNSESEVESVKSTSCFLLLLVLRLVSYLSENSLEVSFRPPPKSMTAKLRLLDRIFEMKTHHPP